MSNPVEIELRQPLTPNEIAMGGDFLRHIGEQPLVRFNEDIVNMLVLVRQKRVQNLDFRSFNIKL